MRWVCVRRALHCARTGLQHAAQRYTCATPQAKPVRGVIADVSKELGQPATTVLVMQEAGGAWGARILPFEDSKLWVVSADTLGDPVSGPRGEVWPPACGRHLRAQVPHT